MSMIPNNINLPQQTKTAVLNIQLRTAENGGYIAALNGKSYIFADKTAFDTWFAIQIGSFASAVTALSA